MRTGQELSKGPQDLATDDKGQILLSAAWVPPHGALRVAPGPVLPGKLPTQISLAWVTFGAMNLWFSGLVTSTPAPGMPPRPPPSNPCRQSQL